MKKEKLSPSLAIKALITQIFEKIRNLDLSNRTKDPDLFQSVMLLSFESFIFLYLKEIFISFPNYYNHKDVYESLHRKNR